MLYFSTASAAMGRQDLEAIVAQSQRNNAADGITGLLLFNGSNFLQLIEGDESPLGGLMRRLYADPRHGGLVKLIDRPIERAGCGGWAMRPIGTGLARPARSAVVAATLPAPQPRTCTA